MGEPQAQGDGSAVSPVLDKDGRPASQRVRVTMGFIPQHLPIVEQDEIHGVRPPEVHPQDFYDAAKAKG